MPNLKQALTRLRDDSTSEFEKGRRFERLVRRALEQHHFFRLRFSRVWHWHDWPDRPGPDLGIDLVAEERGGGLCAIQCKFYAPDSPLPKSAIDSFLTASTPEPYTSRILVNTGADLEGHALRTLEANAAVKHCRVLGAADLDAWPVDWLQHVDDPESLRLDHPEHYERHPYQTEAIDEVCAGFEKHERGKLILPCGTGKTVVTLWIAERQVGVGGRVLCLVPSIALMAQTMREWSAQGSLPMHFEGICSDTRVGRSDEDVSLLELDQAVTTDRERVLAGLRRERPNALTAVFCTYQSLPRVVEAQAAGAPDFDLVICDEAHRTTGVEVEERDTSPFLLVHDAQRLRARKRLYVTATPRIYTEATRRKAQDDPRKLEIFSMDDEAVYGRKFFRMSFADAVEGGYLSDYRVVILQRRAGGAADDGEAWNAVDRQTGLRLEDVEKLHGCWDALADPEGKLVEQGVTGDRHNPLLRAIVFMNTIARSKKVQQHWGALIENSRRAAPVEQQASLLPLEVQHVDGTQNSLRRQRWLNWLREADAPGEEVCRVLSNARCLSEGVDVPALDAVLFMEPRKSQVDVVQAVGRVMRKAEGKKMGYIILPVVISPDQNPEQALNDNKTFQVVWSVLRALRSHDERLDQEIHKLDLNEKPPEHIIIHTPDADAPDDLPGLEQLELDLRDIPPGAIYARIVEKCGDRKYWPKWAEDVAEIAGRIRGRIDALLPDSAALDADLLDEQDGVSGEARARLDDRFRRFLADLQRTLNPELGKADAVAMLAQHLITAPVFEALFSDYDFVQRNPVSQAMSRILVHLEKAGLTHELDALEPFYDSVRRRAAGLDNAEARQTVLLELYERFFRVALRKDAERLGIVYTPVEVVDFILKSADHALQKHLGRRLTDEKVTVLDPFTGTGTFLVRLLQNPDLIRDEDLLRKFSRELHANEIVLLAYYIAAINIEEAFHGRLGMAAAYRPFEGIALSDTFQQYEREQEERERKERGELGEDFNETLPVNSARVQRQMGEDITVIVGNPPYSAGQQSATDDNPNVPYPHLEQRIRDTYFVRSTATLKRSLYDSYKMALSWTTWRIGAGGVVAFVTNGSFIEGNADAGLRACLAEEFSHLYVINLRGNARTSGERRRREKDNVFGVGTRTPIAIMVLVRDPQHSGPGEIHYRDVGDYLSREDKLDWLEERGSIAGINDWQRIVPDAHNDWLDQRDPAYQTYLPLSSKEAKRSKTTGSDVLFRLYSRGITTSKDAWLYSFDRSTLAVRARDMIDFYEERRRQVERGQIRFEDATRNDFPDRFRWEGSIRDRFGRNWTLAWRPDQLRVGLYRAFVKQQLYFDRILINSTYRMPAFFPVADASNQAIGVTGKGETAPFSALMTDATPDLHVIASAQWFPRYRYERLDAAQSSMLPVDTRDDGAVPGYRRVDNLTAWGLAQFRERYPELRITKDDIWHYIYGLLHAMDYREKYRADLSKDLPRIPFAPDFAAFCRAGEQLAALHLGYESCPEYELPVEVSATAREPYRLGSKAMTWGGTKKKRDRSILHVTPFVTLRDIPPAAHDYVVNGRTPLEWAIDRLKVTRDKESGIVSDPNAWFAEDPAGLVAHLRRLVHVSVETARIVGGLPAALE